MVGNVLREVVSSGDREGRSGAGFLARLSGRQDPHSYFLFFAGMLLTGTLVADLVLHRENLDPAVLTGLAVAGMVLSSTALVLGERFPRWLGLSCVVLFALASVYFISPLGDEQSAVSSLQELPILALYLGWFVPRPLSRIYMYSCLALITAMASINPIFHVAGNLGVTSALQAIIAAIFCFEVGSALWRRTEHQVVTDALTGALNRAGFMAKLEAELARSQRAGAPLSLVVVDFDYFKQLNDTQGHAAGDAALAETVRLWTQRLRPRDVVGRTGGDEFAILLDRTDERGAEQIMHRVRSESPHAWSWGISQARDRDSVEQLFDRADERLYAVKRSRE